jgi:hypothetical protein
MSQRIIAIGDLNGAADVLWDILRGTRLINAEGDWIGGRSVLVQIGDIFNRGDGAKLCFDLLFRLMPQAKRAGGQVHIILGNHEVMTILGDEAYCTEGEYLAFATERERAFWSEQTREVMLQLYRSKDADGRVPPLEPRLALWKVQNVPGRDAMRRALSPSGALGKRLRRLPVVVQVGSLIFTHAGLSPEWAARGVLGLNRDVQRAWQEARGLARELPREHLFNSTEGPLWNRTFALGKGQKPSRQLKKSLALLGAERMIVGHTRSVHVPGGGIGRIATRFRASLVCIDVSLSSGPNTPRTALYVEGDHGYEWTPSGRRLLW